MGPVLHLRTRALVAALVLVLAATGALASTAGAVGPPIGDFNNGFLGYCNLRHTSAQEWSCYVRGLLQAIEDSRDPAHELPRLDHVAHEQHGFLEGNCHMLMHVVGREYARRHHVTLANLQRYLPRSNDPGCSAGFGMGMVMALGPQLQRLGPGGAVKTCREAPTRFRQYTCIHSLGHAYMRLYDDRLSYGLAACRALGAAGSPDCAQGAFHDYWLSLSGRDSTTKQRPGDVTSARVLCARQHGTWVLACWYRFYLERPPRHLPHTAGAVTGLCTGLVGLQRAGCIASASLVSAPGPFTQMRICGALKAAADQVPCLRGVGVQNVADSGLRAQVALVRACSALAAGARSGCYFWLGKTLAVVTDGRFRRTGCPRLPLRSARAGCIAGSRHMGAPLITFS